MARGDRVEIVVDTGGGQSKAYSVEATKAGRRVEVLPPRGGVVEVNEVTRNGDPVRRSRFMSSRVIALVETPADEPENGEPS